MQEIISKYPSGLEVALKNAGAKIVNPEIAWQILQEMLACKEARLNADKVCDSCEGYRKKRCGPDKIDPNCEKKPRKIKEQKRIEMLNYAADLGLSEGEKLGALMEWLKNNSK